MRRCCCCGNEEKAGLGGETTTCTTCVRDSHRGRDGSFVASLLSSSRTDQRALFHSPVAALVKQDQLARDSGTLTTDAFCEVQEAALLWSLQKKGSTESQHQQEKVATV